MHNPTLHISLEQPHHPTDPVEGILGACWGIILAKCFLLEWTAQHYAMRISTVPFIWFPTLIFAALGTCIYWGYTWEAYHRSTTWSRSPSVKVWSAYIIYTVTLTAIGLNGGALSLHNIPGLLALGLGSSYYILSGWRYHVKLFQLQALAWWIGGIYMLSIRSSVVMPIFASWIILFWVIPGFCEYLYNRKHKVD